VINEILRKNQFKKDVKRIIKQGKNLNDLENVLSMLIEGETVPDRYKDHSLTGDYNEFRELHLKPDWLLVYKIEGKTLILVRTGPHPELFG